MDIIRAKATENLTLFVAKFTQNKNQQSKIKKGKKTKKKKEDSLDTTDKTLFYGLFDAYDKTEDCLSKCAFAYLLKNNCQVNQDDEDLDKYTNWRRKKEIEIERLRNQLKSQKPKGRDLTAQKWLESLKEATNNLPLNEDEAKSWQASLLTADSYMPYPVDYETNTDLDWFTNSVDKKTKRGIIPFWQAYFLSWALKSGTSSFMKYVYFHLGWFTYIDEKPKIAIIRIIHTYLLNWSLKSRTSSFMKYACFKISCFTPRDVNWFNLKSKEGCIFVKFNGLKEEIKNP
ncbi:hypothetical protein F8S20_40705 [Nostoc sp. BAE]|nr:hypothetical protein [Nostoc commune BAE]